MIEVTRDEAGNITAVCEYLLFKDGQLNEEGNIIFIGDLEINPNYQRKGLVKYFIKTLMDKYPQLIECYFYRRKKYPYKEHTLWTRKQLEDYCKEA